MKKYHKYWAMIIFAVIVLLNFTNSLRTGSLNGEDPKLDLFISVEEIDVNSNLATINAKLSYTKVNGIDYSDKIDMRINSGKISQFNNTSFAYQNTRVNSTKFTFFDQPKEIRVVEAGTINEVIYSEGKFKIEIDNIIPSKFYPFDFYRVNLHFTLFDSKGQVLNPNVHVNFEDQYLDIGKVRRAKNHGIMKLPISTNSEIESSISFNLSRPLNKILLFLTVLILAFFMVFWVSQSVRKKRKASGLNFEILVLNITLILTFPDLRTFVIPENLNFSFFFDYSTVFIWIMTIYSTYLILKFQEELVTKPNELLLKKENEVSDKIEVGNLETIDKI